MQVDDDATEQLAATQVCRIVVAGLDVAVVVSHFTVICLLLLAMQHVLLIYIF